MTDGYVEISRLTVCAWVSSRSFGITAAARRRATDPEGRISFSQRRTDTGWVIPEAKLDQRYGLNVQVIWISGVARLAQALVSGDIDMSTSGGAAVNAILSGAELVYVAIGVPTYAFSLYARPEIKDISDLRGKLLGVLSKGASSDHAAIALLRQHGMRAGRDVKFVYLGGVREILAALDKGIIPAGVLSPPTTLEARRLGFKELVYSQPETPLYS
jgi:ABC-type nitrate/sulfonate/bicarbonate transport system substrate-binding protein